MPILASEWLIILATLGAGSPPEVIQPQPTPERAARCEEVAKATAGQTLAADDPLSRERDVCRKALRAANALVHTAQRNTQQVEETHVRTGVLAASRIVEALNRDGASARFDDADWAFVDAYVWALEAEACLFTTVRPSEREAARRAVQTFNRTGGAARYTAATRRAVYDCGRQPRRRRTPPRIASRVLAPFVPVPGRLSFQGARFVLPSQCSFDCTRAETAGVDGRKVPGRSPSSETGAVGQVECGDGAPAAAVHYSGGPMMPRSFEPYGARAQGTKSLEGALMYWGENASDGLYCVIVTYPIGPDKVITNQQFCTRTSEPESARQRLHAIAETFERIPLASPIEPVCLATVR